MSKTNVLVNGVDLSDMFSSDVPNNQYTNYPALNNLSAISNSSNLLKGTNPTGINIGGNDIVTIFSPIYKDVTSYGVTVVNIPSWVSKIGFVVQAAGGAGGVAYTNYVQNINIPTTVYQGRRVSATNTNNPTYISVQKVSSYSHFSYSTSTSNSFQYHINFATTYTSTSTPINNNSNTTTTTYQAITGSSYTRNGVISNTYNGSSGGGGGCSAGVYVIDNTDRPTTLTIMNNFNNSYSIQFNDSYTTSATSYNGTDAIPNSSSGSVAFPMLRYNSNIMNSSTDTQGSGGITAKNDNHGRIPNLYQTSGSNGGNGGKGGFDNDSYFSTNFLPVINTGNRGTGGNGSNDINIKNYGSRGVVRYWFIR
jgi:hypothetical protein